MGQTNTGCFAGAIVVFWKLFELFKESNNQNNSSPNEYPLANTHGANSNAANTHSTSNAPTQLPGKQHHSKPTIVVSDSSVQELRARAAEHGDKRHALSQQSQEQYSLDNKKEAKTLSDQAKHHQQQMELFNSQASQMAYTQLNSTRTTGELDLHMQFVREALVLVEKRIELCKQEKVSVLVVIVGKGLHSIDGKAKIKPAIKELVERERINVRLDDPNPGCITLLLDQPVGRAIGLKQSTSVDQCPIQ